MSEDKNKKTDAEEDKKKDSAADKKNQDEKTAARENNSKLVETELKKWRQEAQRCQDQAVHALADYQNLLRRQKEDQEKMAQVAKSVIFSSLLQPLNHLSLAAQALNDQGLNMVIDQFWQVLHEQGLKEISPLNQEFNPNTMEAIERTGDGNCVTQVLSPGYALGEQVLQVAKVRVG